MSCGADAKWSSIKAASDFARNLDAQDSKVVQYHSCQQLVYLCHTPFTTFSGEKFGEMEIVIKIEVDTYPVSVE